MKQTLLLISFLICPFFEVLACSCGWAWNDSFSRTAEKSELVALIKVLSFDEYLEDDILGYDEQMPYSMTVEIIKKYKGRESRKKIKVLGDTGILCRPYLAEFKVGSYYLAAPIPIDSTSNTEYDFSVCRTDYLKVDTITNRAYGKYSMIRYIINLKAFERKLKNRDWDYVIISSIVSLLIIIFVTKKLKKE
ncbi:MAG: hypothetical protein JJ971_02370 [Balneolaceae bacterium]|nr:hypothetical protein [Balneolaceae bacterium]MBO6545216.1 hypothetical protein [Balneolaceae bacterium]MBO6646612.1 hypothetical protein [Balneolaceae bacterium]